MLLKVDCRENKLIPLLESIIKGYNNEKGENTIKLEVESLNIGDAMIIDDTDKDNLKNLMMFERKTIADLAGSISDGRYNEQSFRLDKSEIHNHNIIYLIEGDIRNYRVNSRITKNIIYSSMVSLNSYKGFSVIRSFDVNETATIIFQTVCKVIKNKLKTEMFYKNNNSVVDNNANCNTVAGNIMVGNKETTEKNVVENEYIDVIKQTKKSNINKNNINEIMLSQIPCVSVNVSKIVMGKYKTIKNLIKELENSPDVLNDLKMVDSKGKERKINKTSIENIKLFLSI
jgi:ERCC4-type nuclease